MTGIIVLCRFNSTRLPGKILKEINGKPILSYILERLRVLNDKYKIVVCTSVEQTDHPISEFCFQNGIECYRGDLQNVALRFLKCSMNYGFDIAVRINGDNLFVDPLIIENLVNKMRKGQFDFASNVKDRTFPSGISVETVRVSVYEDLYPKFNEYDKEHVMTYFYNWKEGKRYFLKNTKAKGEGINLAIDTEQDFKKAKMILDQMVEDHTSYSYEDIIELYNK